MSPIKSEPCIELPTVGPMLSNISWGRLHYSVMDNPEHCIQPDEFPAIAEPGDRMWLHPLPGQTEEELRDILKALIPRIRIPGKRDFFLDAPHYRTDLVCSKWGYASRLGLLLGLDVGEAVHVGTDFHEERYQAICRRLNRSSGRHLQIIDPSESPEGTCVQRIA